MEEKDQGQLCREIHYRKTENGVVVTGCYGTDGQVVLPDEIDGREVKGIADYAFAENRGEEEGTLIWEIGQTLSGGVRDRICGGMVREIRLPSHVTEIGRYAFYRCKNLKRLLLTDSLLEIGGGAFTGCNLSEVEIHFHEGEQSCLKSILDEIRFAVRAKLCYFGDEDLGRENTAPGRNGTKEARLLFPEHYEEAVENTPARILFTQRHGAGGYYRQCFYDRRLDFKKYDELFLHTVVQEKPDIAAELALGRLRYPFRLTKEAREGYETYLRGHLEDAADWLIEHGDAEGVRFLGSGGYWTGEALDYGVGAAADRKETEILSILMDEKHRRYPRKRRKFEP